MKRYALHTNYGQHGPEFSFVVDRAEAGRYDHETLLVVWMSDPVLKQVKRGTPFHIYMYNYNTLLAEGDSIEELIKQAFVEFL